MGGDKLPSLTSMINENRQKEFMRDVALVMPREELKAFIVALKMERDSDTSEYGKVGEKAHFLERGAIEIPEKIEKIVEHHYPGIWESKKIVYEFMRENPMFSKANKI